MSQPRVIVMPGASLMEITPVAGGARVRCPCCHAEQVFADSAADTPSPATFVHADGCAIHRRIANALSRYESTTVRRG